MEHLDSRQGQEEEQDYAQEEVPGLLADQEQGQAPEQDQEEHQQQQEQSFPARKDAVPAGNKCDSSQRDQRRNDVTV